MNAHLFKHDSTYGAYPGDVRAGDASIIIDGREIKILAERDPAALPWGDLGVDIVLESTGIFTDATKAKAHIDAGAKKVIISAPAKNEDITIVLGVNEDRYDPAAHHIISNASCTTNCLAPAAKVVHDLLTIERGLMNTIHSYTNDQRILDVAHSDPRRARSAGQNIIPTTTGAAKALALVIPDLKGKFDGFSLRVPTPTVSVVDFTATVSRPTSVEELNDAFRAAAAGPLKGILGVSDEPLVSMDFKGDSRSSIIDADVDDGPRRDDGQGHRLVRQRVGLQLPRRRPHRVRRGAPARRRLTVDGQAHDPRRGRRRQTGLRPGRLQRPAGRRQGHRRLADPGRRSRRSSLLLQRRGVGHPGQPPRPTGRQGPGRPPPATGRAAA